MKPSRLFTRKIAVLFATLLVVTASFYAPLAPQQTPKAYAFLGVGDIVFDPANFAANSTQTVILQALNGLAWSVAKLTIQSITRSTVNWINSGFNGSPAFVSDLNTNLGHLSDAVANNFFAQLNKSVYDASGFNITSPFQDQINQQLRQEYYKTTGSWGLNYDLYKKSTDPTAFINGDFSKGGFDAFLSASGNPTNNPFGAYLSASDQLWKQVDVAAQQRKAEIEYGKGFLPWRGNCPQSGSSTATPVSLSTAEPCPFNAVKTPGSVIEQQLENQLGSGVRQLELADSINEIVGALMGQLVNQVLGSNGLLGVSQPSSGGGTSYLNQATDPSQLTGQSTSLAGGVLQNIQNDKTNLSAYRDNWQKILTAANTAQQACGPAQDTTTAIAQSTAAVNRGNSSLDQLLNIEAKIQSVTTLSSLANATQITTAVGEYQSYLSASSTPTPSELSDSFQQSSASTTDASLPSLYSQMVAKASSCK